MLRRPSSAKLAAAVVHQTRRLASDHTKTKSMGFKLKKTAPVEKKKIGANALVKPFPTTVHRAAKISNEASVPAIDAETLQSEDPVLLAYLGDVSKAVCVGSAFSPKRGFELLGERTTLLRKESREVFKQLEAGTPRIVLSGPTNSGKRELLTQAMAWAKTQGWIVLPVPQLLQYINGSSDYALTDSGRLDLLRRNCEFFRKVAAMNPELKDSKLSKDYTFGSQLKLTKQDSLLELLKRGVSTRFQAGEIFDAVITELSLLPQKVLQPIYEVDILARPTEYRTPEYKQLLGRDLQLAQLVKNAPKNFVQIMTAHSSNEVAVALGTKRAADFVYERKFDQSVVDHVAGGHVIKVHPASAAETQALLTYYESRGLVVEAPEKVHVTAGGLLGELWRQVRAY